MPAFAGMTAAIVVGPRQGNRVQHVEVAVIGTGWCGGIRAETLSRSALVGKLHICEIRPDRLAEGTLGKVVSVMVSRHLSRGLGTKIAKRVKLSPVVMESTHDLDFVFWLLEPAKPVRVYSQGAYGYMQAINGSYDLMWSIVTMDNGMMVTVGGGWNLPPSYPNFCSTWIEILGTEGALILDDTHRDAWLNTVAEGTRFPMSTMPGEQVDHVFAGQMGPETIHFLEACIMDRPVMVTPESARLVMETYTAADLSAERNEPVDLPLSNESLSAVAEMAGGKRSGGRPKASASRTSAPAGSECSAPKPTHRTPQ